LILGCLLTVFHVAQLVLRLLSSIEGLFGLLVSVHWLAPSGSLAHHPILPGVFIGTIALVSVAAVSSVLPFWRLSCFPFLHYQSHIMVIQQFLLGVVWSQTSMGIGYLPDARHGPLESTPLLALLHPLAIRTGASFGDKPVSLPCTLDGQLDCPLPSWALQLYSYDPHTPVCYFLGIGSSHRETL
jgi:hypothetical protein